MDKLILREGQVFCLNGQVMTIVSIWSDDNILIESDRGEQLIKKRDDLYLLYINNDISSNRNYKESHYKGKIKNLKITPTLSENQEALIARRLGYVKDCMHIPHGPLLNLQIKKTHERIKDSSEAPSISSVWQWKTRYINSNFEPTSLLPKVGSRGKWQRFNEEEQNLCLEFISTHYLQPNRKSVADTLLSINSRIELINQTRIFQDRLKKITRCLFDRLLNESYTFYEIDLRRWGKNYVTNKYRGVINPPQKFDDALYMGAIDHTELDLKVIDDQGRILERPNLSILLNYSTRCVMGIYLGFTPPGDLSVSKCLKHSLLPKTNLRTEFPEIENEWLAFGPLGCIKVDNAFEFHSYSFENACSHTNTEIIYCPRKQPWFKGEIERFLGLQNALIHQMPGTTFSNPKMKGDYDSNKQAYITLRNLRLYVMKWIVDVYHQRPHPFLNGRSPHEMWKLMVDQKNIPLITELGDIDYLLSQASPATVSHKGVRYDDIWYSSRDLIELRKECGSKFKTIIRYSDEDLGGIWVVHPKNKDFALQVPAIDQNYANGLSRFAHKVNKKRAAEKGYPKSEMGFAIAKADIEEAIRLESKLNARVGRYAEEKPLKNHIENKPVQTSTFSHADMDFVDSPLYEVTETEVTS